jgi:PKD repeat protein
VANRTLALAAVKTASAGRSSRRWLCAGLLLALCSVLPGSARAILVFNPSGFVEDVVASGLPYAVGIAFAPDGRMFIALKDGVVRVYQNGALLPTPFIDISAQTATAVDRGLLGITLHPDFPNTPYVYLLYTWNPPGYPNEEVGSRAARLIRVEADPAQGYNRALAGSTNPQTVPGGPGHKILLGTNSTLANLANPDWGRNVDEASCMTGFSMAGAPVEDCLPSDEDSHTIGTVLFSPDGSLFVSNGDGSNYVNVDPRALRSQLQNSLAGKILRIDPETGAGLSDNPFYDPLCPTCNRSKVYSLGLRNPFRFTFHPLTSEPYVGDVGWNLWEEINTGKGANFGWPCYEGGAAGFPAPVESGSTASLRQSSYELNSLTQAQCAALYAQGAGAVRAPVFSYQHSGFDGAGTTGGASANAGTFYVGTAYPAAYQNALFILDYNRRWIRYLTFNAQGQATVHNFGRETVDGMVQVLTGPDSNLYVVVLNATGSQVRRIRYVAGGNTPPTAVASATPTIGTAPLDVAFSSLGSFDPDAQSLSYFWEFGDGDTSTAPHPTHVYDASGVYTATLTVTELTAPFASREDDVVITVGNEPPLATILTPPEGTTYAIGDVIAYSGSGMAGGEPVDPSQLSWALRLHHNQHQHFQALPAGGAGGDFEAIEHGDDTFYELCLTVTVPPDLVDTRCRSLLPRKTDVTLTTSPAGLLVSYDDEGLTQASPFLVHPVVGSIQTASVAAVQGGLTFQRWSGNVTSTTRQFAVGDAPATYTAEYFNRAPVAVVSATPTSGPAPRQVVFDGSASSDPEFTALTYQWSFGDGGSSTAAKPVHSYASPGTYQAVLTVTDQRGGVDTESVTINVGAPSALCGNGVVNAGEQCDGGGCCTAGCQFRVAGTVCRAASGPCDLAETCSGTGASCPGDVVRPNGSSCSDVNVCNGLETCQAGACTAGTALVCNDANVCTTDTCDPLLGCTFTNNAAPCSDGVACTSDVCSGGTCVSTDACAAGQVCIIGTGVCQQVQAVSIWPSTTTPSAFAGADVPSELGVKFRSDVSGYVRGIRFYKHALNTGTHVGNLWAIDGTRLATATFSNETASGWQEVSFAQPVAIQPGVTYVASYHSPNGYYGFSYAQFATAGVDRPPLHALAGSTSGGNGVFSESAASAFPVSSYFNTNYWVDVAFFAAPPPGPCADTIDQDGDGFLGFPSDPGCASATDLDERSPFLPCDNGVDDDGDGLVDFGQPAGSPFDPDPACASPAAGEKTACQDGLDNDNQPGIDFDGGASLDLDGNGRIDAAFNPATPLVGAADPQCVGKPWAGEAQGCGLGAEMAFLLPLLETLRRKRAKRARSEA